VVAFLAAVALVSGGFIALSARPIASTELVEGSQTENREQKTEDRLLPSVFCLLSSDLPATGRELFFKTMLAVLLVIALGVAAIVTCRKLLPGLTNLPGKQIRILETAHLGPRKAIHLIEIDNQRLLIGSTNENITMLAELDARCSILDTRQELSIENQESRM